MFPIIIYLPDHRPTLHNLDLSEHFITRKDYAVMFKDAGIFLTGNKFNKHQINK